MFPWTATSLWCLSYLQSIFVKMPPFRRTKRDNVEHTYAFKLQVLKWIEVGEKLLELGKELNIPEDFVYMEEEEGAHPGERRSFNCVDSSWPEEKIMGQQISRAEACPVDLVPQHAVMDPSGQDRPQDGEGAGRPVSILHYL